MKHLIIGTAGHVDHGKTMLVKTLTGIDTDRLKEEKERGISIELGFASLTLPGGRYAAIVDVPGHERFIKTMLAGASGIDIVLLIIAADEGVMPQTREHLDIIRLLHVNQGIVVITKTDLVEEDWLELVQEEIKDFLSDTVLKNAAIVKVSAATGHNIPELLAEINRLAEITKEKSTAGQPRLPIDRIFSVTGFGTVVTGTLVSGQLKVGDEIEVFPEELTARVRTLQVHGKSVDLARAGQRVAVNLSGMEVEQISRGNVLALSNTLTPSHRIDVRFLLLKEVGKELKHRSRVRLYTGTIEVLGRIIYFDREELKPGEWAYAQLQLEEPAATAKGDRFVIRSYSPMYTIGGGTIIDAAAPKHKRYRQEIIDRLVTLEKGTPDELIEQYLAGVPIPVQINELAKETGLSQEQVQTAITGLNNNQRIKFIDVHSGYVTAPYRYHSWILEIQKLLNQFHREFPLREGYPKEELRSRKFKNLTPKLFQPILSELESDKIIKIKSQTIAAFDFIAQPDAEQQKLLESIGTAFINGQFQPPGWEQLIKDLKTKDDLQQEILQYLLRQGILIKIADDIYFHRDVLNKAKQMLADYFKTNKEISIGEIRDLLTTSRKYAMPLLEYFDRQRLTRRIGDLRVAGKELGVEV